jgi:hypothetical protein
VGLEKTSCRADAFNIAHLHRFTFGFKVNPSVPLVGFSLELGAVLLINVTLMGLEDA